MNPSMVVAGLVCLGIGTFTFRYPEVDTEFGLRLRGMNVSQLDVDDHSKAVLRTKGFGSVTLLLGTVTMAWGIFGWSGATLAAVLFFGGGLLFAAVFVLTW